MSFYVALGRPLLESWSALSTKMSRPIFRLVLSPGRTAELQTSRLAPEAFDRLYLPKRVAF